MYPKQSTNLFTVDNGNNGSFETSFERDYGRKQNSYPETPTDIKQFAVPIENGNMTNFREN